MQKEYSRSDVLFSVVLSVVVGFSAGMAVDNKIVIADSNDVIILNDYEIVEDRSISDEDVVLSGSVLTKQTLDCYPQINEVTLGKHGYPGKGTEFTCGEAKFLMTSFSEKYSTHVLGGRFPATKTLSQIGCKLEGDLLLCREEGPFKAKGSELKAYREIAARVILATQRGSLDAEVSPL